jgi:1,4-alpha-glucan branching enzyme
MTNPSKWYDNAVLYEMNVRQITPSGTLEAAKAELTRLKKIGVDIVWVMPVQPIGIKGRKGTLGSYYAIKDYTDINPEFGSRKDFAQFVDEAHRLGLKVLLDWVANHTAPDHAWTQTPAWHKRTDDGSLAVRNDWTDIAELNYGSADMRRAMIEAMKFWLTEMRIDGFRCDMAMLVPTDFWEQAVVELKKVNPNILMLAEAEATDLMQNAFNLYYAWELHHAMNDVAQSKSPASTLWERIDKQRTEFPPSAVPMLFTSNHDENSWNGTEFERMGEQGAETFAAFCYLVRGIPLIYTGQEFGNRHRLEFFEKDNIERNPNAPQAKLYTALNNLRKTNPALWNNADMIKINNTVPQHVFSLLRRQGKNSVVGIFNLSPHTLSVRLEDSTGVDYFALFNSNGITFAPTGELHLEAWEYKIGVANL